jgi:hypothetical protein
MFAVALLLPSIASSEGVTLKCINDSGEKMADLVVDLEAGIMTWATFQEYKIIHVDSDYITAFQAESDSAISTSKVGGEIWVLHRSSGRFWRAAVGEYCDESDCSSVHMDTATYEGTCRANML